MHLRMISSLSLEAMFPHTWIHSAFLVTAVQGHSKSTETPAFDKQAGTIVGWQLSALKIGTSCRAQEAKIIQSCKLAEQVNVDLIAVSYGIALASSGTRAGCKEASRFLQGDPRDVKAASYPANNREGRGFSPGSAVSRKDWLA